MTQTSPSSPRRLSILLAAVILAALALPCFAQAPASTPAPAATTAASFVASLAAPAPAPSAPAPIFVQTTSSCSTNADCPTGELCCRACGYFGCTQMACYQPVNGHCPLFP